MTHNRIILAITLFILSFFVSKATIGQVDSVWSVMILKKGETPTLKYNMAEFSKTGFYLYRNCVYDFELTNGVRYTYKLTGIKQDTLIFTTIPKKTDNPNSKDFIDTVSIQWQQISFFYIVNVRGTSKIKIDFKKYYFVFSKTKINFQLDGKIDTVFYHPVIQTELIPRLTNKGVLYYFAYNGKLHYKKGLLVSQPKYSDEEKEKALSGVITILDFIVNKRVTIAIKKKN